MSYSGELHCLEVIIKVAMPPIILLIWLSGICFCI
uniref:Uncharacterized protein n=1 Tax=Rhizophora mucronata TaxID=61149 RepID=A0A2P2NMR6_RHIMU